MKFFGQFLLLWGVGLLCFRSSACSKGPAQPHGIHKRGGELTSEQVRCLSLIQRDQCTSGSTQEYVDLAVQCGDRIYRNLQEDCAVNAMGGVCFSLYDAIISDEEIIGACGSPPTSCSSECRNLLTTTRDQLGCCVNTYNDTELSSRADSLQFSYSLWSLCGVELVAEQCESTIDSTRTHLDPTCTEANFTQQLHFNVFCRRQFIDSTINAVGDACDSVGTPEPNALTCAANEEGQYCLAIPSVFSFGGPASRACTNTSVCDPLCMEALNNGTNFLGCCYITLFNDTEEAQRDWLTQEFWQRCGLTSPGFCEQRFNGAPLSGGVILRAPSCVVALALALICAMFKLY